MRAHRVPNMNTAAATLFPAKRAYLSRLRAGEARSRALWRAVASMRWRAETSQDFSDDVTPRRS
jgi:hypothetical protein